MVTSMFRGSFGRTIRTFSEHASRLSPSFPCVEAHSIRASRIIAANAQSQIELGVDPEGKSKVDSQISFRNASPSSSGPEPPYARPTPSSYQLFSENRPLDLVYSPPLPCYDVAYETWGKLSPAKDNAILLFTGLSASSHAAPTPLNPSKGWWGSFVGPNKALDTDYFFVICANVLGGCYGSTGPSSINPENEQPYATHFPIISIFDMVNAQFRLLDHLGITKLYASVGSSMGAMQSLAAGWLFPHRAGKLVSISGTARSSPSSIAMRFAQRSVLMSDPNWNNGFYYGGLPPHAGMKLARQIATITYRSGPEWDLRFARRLRPLPSGVEDNPVDSRKPRLPALCPDFLIETYLDHQGEEFCLKYDANSLIYISKAMDLFDMTAEALEDLNLHSSFDDVNIELSHAKTPTPATYLTSLAKGLTPIANTPVLILGVQSDILFPVDQQRECAEALRMAGNNKVVYYELGGVWGHDTFLIDVQNVGGAIRGFLS